MKLTDIPILTNALRMRVQEKKKQDLDVSEFHQGLDSAECFFWPCFQYDIPLALVGQGSWVTSFSSQCLYYFISVVCFK